MPKPESSTSSSPRPRPITGRAKPRLFREIFRAAGVLGLSGTASAAGSENCPQEFQTLAKKSHAEIPGVQENQGRPLVGACRFGLSRAGDLGRGPLSLV